MDSFFRSIISVLFIGLIVIGIVFFSIFIMIPTKKFSKSNKNTTSTFSVVKKTPISPLDNILNSFVPGLVPGKNINNKQQQKQELNENKDSQTIPKSFTSIKPEPAPPEPAPPEKPFQSAPIQKKDISNDVIKISVSANGFLPNTITVDAGKPITFAIISGDEQTHIFKFKDKSLSDVVVGVGPKETRTIAFISPQKIGEYEFYCDVPGHKTRGEIGKMIVK